MSHFTASTSLGLTRSLTGLCLTLAAFCMPAHSQTLYGLEAVAGSAPVAVELTGGPGPGLCGYPSGPFGLPVFAASAAVCPGPAPFAGFPASMLGDIGVNHLKDTVWIAGPMEAAEYTMSGVQIAGFMNPLAGPIRGLGVDSLAGTVWLTDGAAYVEVSTACAGLPAVVSGPFANPLASAMTDLTWDLDSLALWASFADGSVAHIPPGFAPVCVFGAPGLGLAPPLTGIAVDTTTPGVTTASKCVFVTNGTSIARVDVSASCAGFGPVLAAPSFAFPTPFMAVASGPISGLAFADHGVEFGVGSGPEIDYSGQATLGTTNTVTLVGATPGVAGLFVDFAALCPPLTFKALPLHVFPFLIIGPISHAGAITLPLSLGPGTPVGLELYMQWFNKGLPVAGAAPVWESTPAMLLTIGRP
jgi:hypothetical protein